MLENLKMVYMKEAIRLHLKPIACLLALISNPSYSYEIVNLAEQAVKLAQLPVTATDEQKISFWDENIESVDNDFSTRIYITNRANSAL